MGVGNDWWSFYYYKPHTDTTCIIYFLIYRCSTEQTVPECRCVTWHGPVWPPWAYLLSAFTVWSFNFEFANVLQFKSTHTVDAQIFSACAKWRCFLIYVCSVVHHSGSVNTLLSCLVSSSKWVKPQHLKDDPLWQCVPEAFNLVNVFAGQLNQFAAVGDRCFLRRCFLFWINRRCIQEPGCIEGKHLDHLCCVSAPTHQQWLLAAAKMVVWSPASSSSQQQREKKKKAVFQQEAVFCPTCCAAFTFTWLTHVCRKSENVCALQRIVPVRSINI